jgi:hypothetical protein
MPMTVQMNINSLTLVIMKQENLQKLLSLVSNWMDHVAKDEEATVAVEEMVIMMDNLSRLSREHLTDEQKSEMYWQTVHALNAGSDEAEKGAFLIRLRALISGDDELIEKIEYLHEVI